jgi:hypothetical protein
MVDQAQGAITKSQRSYKPGRTQYWQTDGHTNSAQSPQRDFGLMPHIPCSASANRNFLYQYSNGLDSHFQIRCVAVDNPLQVFPQFYEQRCILLIEWNCPAYQKCAQSCLTRAGSTRNDQQKGMHNICKGSNPGVGGSEDFSVATFMKAVFICTKQEEIMRKTRHLFLNFIDELQHS